MLISGQVHSEGIGRELGALHEVHDQQEAVRPVTKWRHRVTHAEEVPAAIHEAVRQLSTGRPRPVEVEILPDILAAEADVEIIEPEVYPRPAPDADAVQRAAELLAGARRPLIWAGGGVNLSGAPQELQQVAELLNAPVVTTAEGHGALPYAHPLLMGAMNYSWGPGRDLVPHADVVLAVGTRFGSHRRDPAESLNPPQKLINLNVDETEFGRSYAVDVGIATDARVGLQHLAQALRGRGVQGEWDAAGAGRDQEQGEGANKEGGASTALGDGRAASGHPGGRVRGQWRHQHRGLEHRRLPYRAASYVHHLLLHGYARFRIPDGPGHQGGQPR